MCFFFFFQAEDGIRDYKVTGVQTCALPILRRRCDVAGFRVWACRIAAPGKAASRGRSGCPVAWVFSPYVVQAGSARVRGLAPTAFNRAGEKSRATGGGLPKVVDGVVPGDHAGSPSPSSGRKV